MRGRRWRVKIIAFNPADLEPVVVTAPGRRRGKRARQPELFDLG
jgi:hypothetical protein